MIDCPEGYRPYTEPCPECHGTMFDYKKNGPHLQVKCVFCGKHIKYLPRMDNTEWKKEVKQRDNYTCQRCGAALTSRQLDAHHKIPVWFMDKLQFDLDNGITLCKKCHKQLHGIDGTIKDDYKEET